MHLKRRDFLQLSALGAGSVAISGIAACKSTSTQPLENVWSSLPKMTLDVVPISIGERELRIAKAQQFMNEQGIVALLLDAGTSLAYFTGIQWGASERPMVAIIPAKGEVMYICPGFEESRLREKIHIGKSVYPWQEDESPYQQMVKALNDQGIVAGKIGNEERVRFFIFDGIRKIAPQFSMVSGDGITATCRMIKSPAEIALMQKASDITLAAIKIGIGQLKEGMMPAEFAAVVNEAHAHFGATSDFAMALFGESSSMPHGSIKPKSLQKGDIVLMDCGCSVEGYQSDISRTIVFGAVPTQRQQTIWQLEKQAQAAGFSAAKNGIPCEAVDQAARKVITDAGFGPGYQLPGLPHRTGHGIGMDGHEWGNMVKGNTQLLQPGMCFSIEPTISIPGEFGIRLEDCAYMTEQGPQWFSKPSIAIDQPFG